MFDIIYFDFFVDCEVDNYDNLILSCEYIFEFLI